MGYLDNKREHLSLKYFGFWVIVLFATYMSGFIIYIDLETLLPHMPVIIMSGLVSSLIGGYINGRYILSYFSTQMIFLFLFIIALLNIWLCGLDSFMYKP